MKTANTKRAITEGTAEKFIQGKTKDLRDIELSSIEPAAAETLLSHENFGLNLKVSLPCPPF